MSRHATISLVNFPGLPSDEPDRLTKTLARMGDHVDQAAALGNDLVAFPEACSRAGSVDTWACEPLEGPTLAAMSRKAKQREIWIVCPMGTMDGDRKRNSSVLIDRKGRIAGVYHKNFPTHPELDYGIIPGTDTPVFETDFGRVGLCVCFDLDYWEVGAGLCANKAELVIWSSMWPGGRMLARWAIEFGFYMGAAYSGRSTFVDIVGRELASVARCTSDVTGSAPLVTATLDLDRRLLHHDFNLEPMKRLFAAHGPTAAHAEWIPEECLLVFGSRLPGVSSDELIREFGLETMRDYLARTRRDRQRALQGTYPAARSTP
ncbi:MAG: carbon-nitrogen hydrolase family protein [Planctomycetota bacterium]